MGVIGHLRLLDRATLPRLPVEGEIASSLREATRALNAGAPRAASVMLRRAVELWCAEAGGEGNLAAKIATLQTTGRIRPVTAAGLHAVRFLGNDAAHVDSRHYDDLTIDDALEALNLVVRLIQQASRP